jgi:hypothetical protein
MSIDNIPTNYSNSYYDPFQAEYTYLNKEINGTVGPESIEYITITSQNYTNLPKPTYQNKIVVYNSNPDDEDPLPVNFLILNILTPPAESVQTPFTISIYNSTKFLNLYPGLAQGVYIPPRQGITVTIIENNETSFKLSSAQYTIIDLSGNVIFSAGVLRLKDGSSDNVVISKETPFFSGNNNVAVGNGTLSNLTDGNNNIAIGFNANTTDTVSVSNSIILGANATATASNQLVLGSNTNPLTTSTTAGAIAAYLPVLLNGIEYKLQLYAP